MSQATDHAAKANPSRVLRLAHGAARTALVAALASGLAAAPVALSDAVANAAGPGVSAPAATLKVTATKDEDPRYGDPLRLTVRAVSPTGEPVSASISMNGIELDAKVLPATFEIPTTGLQIGTSYRVDVAASTETLSGVTFERFTPQLIQSTIVPTVTTIAYSRELLLRVVPNKPTAVPFTNAKMVKMPWGVGYRTAYINEQGLGSLATATIEPGTYQVQMDYEGDAVHAPTTPGAGSFSGQLVVTKMTTKTTNLLSRTELTQGEVLSTSVQVQSTSEGTTKGPAGIFRVIATPVGGGEAVEVHKFSTGDNKLTTVDLSSFAASHAGDWVIRGAYEGSAYAEPSFSETTIRINESGNPVSTTTTGLELAAQKATVGGNAVEAIATVAVTGGAAPTGKVAFFVDNVQVGADTSVDAQGVARMGLAPEKIGTRSVIARYIGTATQEGSASPSRSFVVEQAASDIITMPATAVVGAKLSLGVVAVGSALKPTGTVTVSEGSTVLGAVPLVAGKGTFTVPQLSLGLHELTLVYSGDDNVAGSQTALGLTVKAGTQVPPQKPVKVKSSVKASFKKLSKHRVKAKVYVRASKAAAGRVEIRYGSKVVAKGTLKAGAKSITLKTKKLKKGKRKLTIRYLGSSTVSASAKSYKVRVR